MYKFKIADGLTSRAAFLECEGCIWTVGRTLGILGLGNVILISLLFQFYKNH